MRPAREEFSALYTQQQTGCQASSHPMQMKSSSQCAYLAGEGPDGLGPALRHVGVFLCADELRGRGVYGLHVPMRQRRAAGITCRPLEFQAETAAHARTQDTACR